MTEIVSLPDLTDVRVDAAPSDEESRFDVAVRGGAALRGGVLSIGNFDGVHRGHASLLRQTQQLAEQLGGPSIACLFDPHPIAILRPDLAPKRLTSVEERARRMSKLGIDYLLVCETSRELLELSAEAFFHALVLDRLACRGLVEGENFCFGKDRRGNVELLKTLCREHDIEFRVAEMAAADGAMISSTRIRDLLSKGDIRSAHQIMDAPHVITGTVVQGDQRGRTIGFPTANLDQIDVVIPASGVYAGVATVDDQEHLAAVHIGESPTFQSGASTKVEVHLIDFAGDLYGQTVSVELFERVRGAVRFESADSLVEQLRKDIQTIQPLLEHHLPNRSR